MGDAQFSALHAKRRLPLRSLLISLTGAIAASAIGAYAGRYGLATLPASVAILGGLMVLMMIGQWSTLAYYVFSPKRLTFDEQAMIYGGKTYPYADMTGIGSYVSKAATEIRLSDGKRLLLRWDIWQAAAIWERLLEDRTLPHLWRKAHHALERGEQVSFGPGASLDQNFLTLRKGSIPIAAISTIRFVSQSNMGAQSRILHIADEQRELTVDEDHLRNRHVLFALLAEKLPANRSD
ncbi:hypothetical protein [Rhizobium sp. NPDC092017]|uniref:hypothetical protein n=1 Tax=Rhizobium sp. NPDC092017 TaxID=3364502 RepID=UPI00382CB207